MNSPEYRLTFAGHGMILNARGVLYWPVERLLIASDLHLEKGSYFAQHGSVLPPYDTLDTLERLEQCITHYRPERLLLLGDSFHDRFAWQRLGKDLQNRIQELSSHVPAIHWIEGNHDVGLQGNHRFELQMEIGGILFTHDYVPGHAHQIIGHYHPKAALSLGKRSLRAPCFATAPHLIMMPAFGSYTGGLDINDEAIRALAKDTAFSIHMVWNNNLYTLQR